MMDRRELRPNEVQPKQGMLVIRESTRSKFFRDMPVSRGSAPLPWTKATTVPGLGAPKWTREKVDAKFPRQRNARPKSSKKSR